VWPSTMTNKSPLEKENEALKDALRSLVAWAFGRQCNDCYPFREGPSCISWVHHKDCGYLEAVNKALILLGLPKEEGHDRIDPIGDMVKLAQERVVACRKAGLIK
jgi:hypothetical protein